MELPTPHTEKEYPKGLASFEDFDKLASQAAEKACLGELLEDENGKPSFKAELDLIKGRGKFSHALKALGDPSEVYLKALPSPLVPEKSDYVFELSFYDSATQEQAHDVIGMRYSGYYESDKKKWLDSYSVMATPGNKHGSDGESRSVAPILFTAKQANALIDLLRYTEVVNPAEVEER